jgi:hypothetical protein
LEAGISKTANLTHRAAFKLNLLIVKVHGGRSKAGFILHFFKNGLLPLVFHVLSICKHGYVVFLPQPAEESSTVALPVEDMGKSG